MEMSSKNGIVAGSIIFATLAIGGFFYYINKNPQTDVEKHMEVVKKNLDKNVVSSHGFATFGGSTRRHKKGNKHTKKHTKH